MVAICGIIIGAATVSEGTDQILNRYSIEGTVFGATIVTAVLSIEDLFLTVRPIRRGVPEIGIGNVIGSLIFSVTGKLGIVVLAGGSVAIGSSVLHWHLPVLARADRRSPHTSCGPGDSSAGTASCCSGSTSPTGSSASSSTAAPRSTTDATRAAARSRSPCRGLRPAGRRERQARADARPRAARAGDVEPAAERVDPVGEPAQAGPAGRVGAAAAVVDDLDEEHVRLGRDADPDRGGAGVPARVRERLATMK